MREERLEGGTGHTEAPLVSVIIPAFNAEATLGETLASVAAQTYENLEIIIVDDGSSDKTALIAEAFCRDDPRAHYLYKVNGGVASARNMGIAHAAGSWIAPLDADDVWHPSKIEKQVAAAMAEAEQPGFVYCWHQHINAEGAAFATGPRRTISGRAVNQLAYFNPVQNGSALLIARNAALAVEGFDTSLRARGGEGCEDQMIQLQIAARYPVAVVPEHLVGYRFHPSSMSQNYSQILRSWNLVYDDVAEQGFVSPRVIQWTIGLAHLGLAESHLRQGAFRAALRPLAAALRMDPVRCAAKVAYRVLRFAVMKLRGRKDRPPPVPFDHMDPSEILAPDPNEILPLIDQLERLETARLRLIAKCEKTAISA